jgi:phosphoglycolate phosphatase
MRFKGILFDKDGTLISSEGTWAPFYKSMLKREKGISDSEIVALMVHAGYDPATNGFHGGSVLAGGTARQLVELWWPGEGPDVHEAITIRMQDDSVPLSTDHVQPLFDLAPVLHGLSMLNFQLGVATNDGERSARSHMKHLKIENYFKIILGSDSVVKPKPSGLMVKRFAEFTGLRPQEVVMVGDNRHDLEEARNGGAGLAIGVLTGNSSKEQLAPYADHVLDSIKDLEQLLQATI